METLTLVMLVKGIAWGGSVGIVIWLASHYGDKWPAYKALDSMGQRLIMWLVAVVISFTAYALITYVPDSFWQAAQPYFLIGSVVAGAIFGGQGIYLARRAGPIITDMNKIRATGMIVPDNHPLLTTMKQRVADQAAGASDKAATVQPPPPPGEHFDS